MYENASVTPVATWMMNAQSVALPKTYHQRAPRGTGCAMIGFSVDMMPRRSSSVDHTVRRRFFAPFNMPSANRNRVGANFDAAIADATRIFREAVRRWARR